MNFDKTLMLAINFIPCCKIVLMFYNVPYMASSQHRIE